MEVYLVYEFTYPNFYEDITEEFNIIGTYYNYETAQKKANERVTYGIKNYDVVIDPDIKNKDNPFEETRELNMYRENSKGVELYSINIETLHIE